MSDRGRITVVEVVLTLFVLAFMYALWPVVSSSLDAATGQMSVGTVYLIRIMLPLMLLVLLSVIYVTANSGGGMRR